MAANLDVFFANLVAIVWWFSRLHRISCGFQLKTKSSRSHQRFAHGDLSVPVPASVSGSRKHRVAQFHKVITHTQYAVDRPLELCKIEPDGGPWPILKFLSCCLPVLAEPLSEAQRTSIIPSRKFIAEWPQTYAFFFFLVA